MQNAKQILIKCNKVTVKAGVLVYPLDIKEKE